MIRCIFNIVLVFPEIHSLSYNMLDTFSIVNRSDLKLGYIAFSWALIYIE